MKSFFNQKVVIITGSSMGIGKSLAMLLGKQGSHVVLNARNEDKLLATETELKNAGCNVISYAGDMSKEEDCNGLIAKTIEHYGKIYILINNAGLSMRGMMEQLSPNLVSTIFNTNTIAPIILSQKAIPYIKQTKGSILFISSLAAMRGLPLISIYCASKMALTAVSESMRIETKPDGIHIGIVYIGFTKAEDDKTVLNTEGIPILLGERNGAFNLTTNKVAKKISQNIELRKNKTVIGISGNLYYFLSKFFPRLLELIITRSQKQVKQLSK